MVQEQLQKILTVGTLDRTESAGEFLLGTLEKQKIQKTDSQKERSAERDRVRERMKNTALT